MDQNNLTDFYDFFNDYFLGRSMKFNSISFLSVISICCFECAPTPPPMAEKPVPVSNEERIPFTEDLRLEWKFSDEEIKGLQFYVNSTVTLFRANTSGDRSIKRGKLVLRSGQYVEEIELQAGTPGIVTQVMENSVKLCFEGTCDATIEFGCKSECREWEGKYNTLAKSWEGNVGTVNYGDVVYSISPATFVEIDKESLSKLETKRRILPGKRLDTASEKVNTGDVDF